MLVKKLKTKFTSTFFNVFLMKFEKSKLFPSIKNSTTLFFTLLVFYALAYKINVSHIFSSLILFALLSSFLFLLFRKLVNEKRLALFCLSFFFILSTVEIGVRTFTSSYNSYVERTGRGSYISPYDLNCRSWYFRHGINVTENIPQNEFSYTYQSNELGIFAKKLEQIDPSKYKILCLGDSFTEGVGASQDSCWPALLQLKLDQSYPDSFEVINAGIGGSDIYFEWKLYEGILSIYEPDEIIFALNTSDITDIMVRGGDQRFLPDSSVQYNKAPFIEQIYKTNYISRAIIKGFLDYNYIFITGDQQRKLSGKVCNEMSSKFKEMEAVLSTDNIKMSLILHPTPGEIALQNYWFLECFAAFKQIDFTSTQTIDLFNPIKENDLIAIEDLAHYSWPKDGHFNGRGYELLSKLIFETKYASPKAVNK